jgi:hypothetical protein
MSRRAGRVGCPSGNAERSGNRAPAKYVARGDSRKIRGDRLAGLLARRRRYRADNLALQLLPRGDVDVLVLVVVSVQPAVARSRLPAHCSHLRGCETGSLAVVGFLFLLVLLPTPTLLAAREPETVKCRYGREQFRPALPAARSAKPRKRRAQSFWKRSRWSPNSLSQ